jgi:hypothetical protein
VGRVHRAVPGIIRGARASLPVITQLCGEPCPAMKNSHATRFASRK